MKLKLSENETVKLLSDKCITVIRNNVSIDITINDNYETTITGSKALYDIVVLDEKSTRIYKNI